MRKSIKEMNRLFLAMVAVSLAGSWMIGYFLPEITLYQSLALSEAIYLLPLLVYIICTGGRILEEMQVKLLPFSTVLMLILFGFLIRPLMTWLNLLSMLFSTNYVASSLTEVGGDSLWRNMMYIAIVPAVAEEFIFRGVFYHNYRSAGIFRAALASGLCFGLLHMNLNQFVYAFVLGVVFALLTEAAGSVTASMIPHFMINAGSVLSLWLSTQIPQIQQMEQMQQEITRQEIWEMMKLYSGSALINGALAMAVFWWIAGHNGRKDQLREALHFHRGEKKIRIWSPALAAAVLICFVCMVVVEFA